MKRIMILGPSNAGKSTLARKLGEQLNLPVHHLDKYFWRENWSELPFEEAQIKHADLIAQEKWIIDGGWGPELRESRVKRADTVIIMDFPRHVIVPRWFKRLWNNRGTVREDMGGNNIERFNFDHFRKMIRHKNSSKRVAWLKSVAPNIQLYILHNVKEVNSFLSQF